MTKIATLTSKGQFTIPKAIRDRLSLKAGTTVEVTQRGGSFIVRPVRSFLKIEQLRGSLAHLDDGRPTKEIIEEALRNAAREIAREH